MRKRFQRTIEDFTCEQCGFHVAGSGYTNHCPRCLYSKHVDINPGDRAATCDGLMQPVAVGADHGEQTLLHRCLTCGHEKWNKIAEADDVDAVIQISSQQ